MVGLRGQPCMRQVGQRSARILPQHFRQLLAAVGLDIFTGAFPDGFLLQGFPLAPFPAGQRRASGQCGRQQQHGSQGTTGRHGGQGRRQQGKRHGSTNLEVWAGERTSCGSDRPVCAALPRALVLAVAGH